MREGLNPTAMEENTMSEHDNTTVETEQDVQGTDPEETPELGDAGKRAIKAERDARKAVEQQLAAVQAQLREREQAEMSELERAQAEAKEAAEESARLRQESTRANVALREGVPVDLIEFLTGSTEEEMTARAKTLLARLNAPSTPKPDLRQGAQGGKTHLSTAEQFAQQLGEDF